MITVFTLIVLLFSVIIHEISHGSAALLMGDHTAKNAGRLSLNPLKHLDFFGSILIPLIMSLSHGPIVGWAKPVPVNPYNFKDQRWGELKVSLAGPAANFLIAIIFSLFIRFLPLPGYLPYLFSIIAIYNFVLAIFNLIPIPPLDGSHILFSLLPAKFSDIKNALTQYGFFILILFILFGVNIVFSCSSFLFSLISGQY